MFVPYAGDGAAWLFVAGAAGMLTGDIVMGRCLDARQRRTAATWLRVVLALPFLAFWWQPSLVPAAVLAGVACVGYAATLGQQELLVSLTATELSGQVLGAESAARVTCQGLAAALAGGIAEVLDPGTTMTLLALGSLMVSVCLTPALARTARESIAVDDVPSRLEVAA
jgi:predicted MFS family arabinose efflux permease